MRAVAPVVMIIASPRYSVLPTHTPNGDAERSTRSASAVTNSAPKRSACSRNFIISSGPEDAVGEAGEVLDVGGEHELAARADALDHDRLQVGAARVDGRGEPRGSGADDQEFTSFRHSCPRDE